MKQILKYSRAALLLLTLVFLLAACGQKKNPLAGTAWTLAGVVTPDGSFTGKDLARFGAASLKLLEDGNAELSLGGVSGEGQYHLSEEDGTLTAIVVGGETKKAAVEADTLTLVLDDTVTLHFLKDPEPVPSGS